MRKANERDVCVGLHPNWDVSREMVAESTESHKKMMGSLKFQNKSSRLTSK
jgi:hypothetical protein